MQTIHLIMKFPLFTLFFFMPLLTMLFSIDVALVSGKCQSDHQSLLLELKNSLIFDESISTILVTWNSTTDCCEWRGISCDVGGLGHVTGLDLSCESISGGLDNSSNLFDLQSLQSLDLSLNDFNITLPTRFANLTNLVSLNLHAAGFKDQIPSEISKLTKLVSLRLSSVYDVPMKLEKPNLATLVQNLTELTELYLDGVNISASGREWCQALSSSLPNLKVLSLSNCFLSGPIDASLAKLQSLSIIDLSGNNLSAPVPEFFANYSKLIALQLPSCKLKGILPQTIFQVPTLEIIDLSSNMLTGSIPSFSTSKKLTYVDLYLNQLTGEVPSSHWEGLLNLAFVDLGHNALSGSIPLSLFAIPSLQTMQLSNNRFWGQVPEFPNVSSSLLHTLDLSSNKLEGPIPSSVFGLAKLNVLKLSSNKLNGTMQLHWIHRLRNLTSLDLSYNNLTVNAAGSNSTASSLPQIRDLRLASCNLRMFPDLSNQSKLFHLDLSDNQITGLLPGWISAFNILQYLNLSSNLLVGLEKPLSLPSLLTIDLHSNQLQGSIPVPPSFIVFVDYSSNNFTSSIPHNIGNYLNTSFFFSLSNNKLTGVIPQSICTASWLQVLDLSNNNLSGMIPACLIERIDTLHVLNLRRNNFDGNIPDKFPSTCELKTLDLSGNKLQGLVPKSLASCTMLEVLDLGNNQISDMFPCQLKSILSFSVLILRHNMFYGRIGCPLINGTWPMLQIADLASNNFSGNLPQNFLKTWKAMMGDGKGTRDHIRFEPLRLTDGVGYEDSVTVTIKGLELELVKILTIFKSVDFSNNNFDGPIPDVFGQFDVLYSLNLSSNALSGQIPSSLGNLRQLESLDLSVNHLTGAIPQQIASLTFLSFLNLSKNKLVGSIPTGSQFQTFLPDSFIDNERLCGFPLNNNCSHESPPIVAIHSNSGVEIKWNLISAELGYVFGLGIIILPLMFCKRWRIRYYKHVNHVLFRIFPQLDKRCENHGRRAQGNRRRQSQR